MHVVAKTDVGLVRKRNEDYFVVANSHDLVVLCDGMGGHPGGDVASKMAAEEVQRMVVEGFDGDVALESENAQEILPFIALLHGVFVADRKLREYGRRYPEYQGMGTTLVAMQEQGGVLCVAHVGDSRVYSFKGGRLTQVTNDHSVVATHPEYAHLAGMRNILTRAMGVGDELEVDFTITPAQKDEIYLLCTDGLHNYVKENRIVEVLGSGKTADEQVETLIEDAKQGGGGDNITLSLAWVTEDPAKESRCISGVVTEDDSELQVQLVPPQS
ncbi:MAG: PP2C family protein-serine/threonine phosphatase [Candidatus Krumholzibacteriia bacterium]